MRLILLIATMAVACQATAQANEPSSFRLAQSSPQTDAPAQAEPAAPLAPAAQPAPAAPAPQAAAPAPQATPAPSAGPTAAAPEAAPPAPKASKPAKKRVAKRHNWEADEAKARSIAAKYGVTW
jgi:hypothetical protein